MKSNSVKQVILRLYTVLMIAFIFLAVAALIAIGMGIRPRILITSSMEPSILKNSLVLVDTSAPYESLSEGQVIAFRTGRTEVLHRISEITEGGSLIVVPDNGAGEALVGKASYVGAEIVAFPFIGGWLRSVLRHIWVVVVVAVGLMIVGCFPWREKAGG